MQIHELNDYGGSLDSGAYLGIDNGTDTGRVSYTKLLEAINARVDNIIAGEAPSAAEVVDARYGADGVSYASLGDSIRGQASGLKNDINLVAEGDTVAFIDKINYIYGTPVNGKYISYNTGNIGTNASWSYYFPIKIEGGFWYSASFGSAHVAFYDDTLTYISGVLVASDKRPFQAPSNAAYMAYSYQTADGAQYVERSIEQKIEYVEPRYKKLDRDIALDINHFTKIVEFGKNLFNRWNTIDGKCIDYGDADKLWTNASYCYCPDFIPCKPSTSYTINQVGGIIGEYDADGKATATHNITTASVNKTFTTTADTKYLKVGTQIALKSSFQIEEGSTSTSYEAFTCRFKYGQGGSAVSIITVKQDGTGNFTTISEAIANASDDAIILVYDGTYEESVKTYSKRVHIIGTNREKCILSYSGLDYRNPPLEMAKGSVRNLTIKATNSGTQGERLAYCVHIDNDNEANEQLTFTNVDFINQVHQAVGIGLRAHFTLEFDMCRFRANDQAGLYCHDWETSDESADKTGQRLMVRNCSIVNNSASKSSIMLQSQELVDGGAEATFIGNVVVNKGSDKLIEMVLWAGRTLTNDNFLGSSDWVLSDDSALNTLSTINNI